MKHKLLTLAGALALLAVLGHFYAKPLLAQVRAALVQNVDEPGRNPIPLGFAQVTGGQADFIVPAGKRYVVEAFAANCFLDNASSVTAVRVNVLTSSGDLAGEAFAQALRVFVNPTENIWAASTTTRLYVNPGGKIQIGAISAIGTIDPSFCEFTVSGYAINLP